MSVYQLFSDGSINPAGWLGFAMNEPDPIVSNAALDSSCRYIFHAQTGSNSVEERIYDASTHHFQDFIPAAAGTAPVWVATDSSLKFLYAANSGSNNVSAYVLDAPSGTITPVPGSPFSAGAQPSSVVVVQSWVYVTNAGDNTVSAFSFNQSTGVLTPVPGSPFTAGTRPVGLISENTDLSHSPSGMLLYVANQGSNNLSAFVIAANGALQAMPGSPFPTGPSPKNMVIAQTVQ